MDNQITTMQEVTPATQKAYDTHARILANGQVMARALVDVCHDLKTMRDEGLYTELGYDTFEEYAEQACGIKQRQAYSYISAYEKLGQKYMADHADLGITKLELISQINSYEREEFAADVDLESATVRELKAEVERYKKQTEQLTFDLGQAQSELSEAPEPVDMDTLRSSIEQGVKAKYSAQLEELQQRADAAPDPEAIRKEAKKEAAKEYKAKLATAKADAEEKTKAAVIKFQKQQGISQTGTAGPQTLRALGISIGSVPSATEQNINLLARIISAEARGEPYVGQVAVGAVILNRIEHPSFPDTLSGVIYQNGAFTAVVDGQFNEPVAASAYNAARDALNGWDPTNGCVYYYNPAKTSNAYMHAKPTVTVIGSHRFCM